MVENWLLDNYLELIRHERFSEDELHAYSWKKRTERLKYAYENTRFYKRFYDEQGVNPNDVKTEDDWDMLPVVTREMVRDQGDEMVVEPLRAEGELVTTSGSTGKPLRLWLDRKFYRVLSQDWRMAGWWVGRKPGKVKLPRNVLSANWAIVRRLSGVGAPSYEQRQEILKRIYPQKMFWLDSQNMSEALMRTFNEECRGAVDLMYGYSGAMAELARYYLSGAIERSYQPWAVSTGASMLLPQDRIVIEKAFGCPCYDTYGCNELGGGLGAECSVNDGSMHIYSDMKHLDLIDDAGKAIHDDSVGRTVFTSLVDRVMPLIRYKLGDYTHFVKGKCPCGLPFPRIGRIEGRMSDYLEDISGGKVFGLNAAFDDYPNCAIQYQFVQHAPGNVTLRVVKNAAYADAEKEVRLIFDGWAERMRGRIRMRLEYVDSIPSDKGKLRFIVYE